MDAVDANPLGPLWNLGGVDLRRALEYAIREYEYRATHDVPMFLEALSPQERYARELEKLLGEVDRLEERAVRRVIGLLAETRRQIIATLADVPEEAYLASYLPRLQVEIEQMMTVYVDRYSAYFEGEVSRAWDLGIEALDRPLAAAKVTIMAQLPAMEPRYLDILQGFRAALISDTSDQAISRITAELQLGVVGGKTPYQIQQAVTSVLRTQPDAGGIRGTIATRAETITVTELNRTFSLATQSRQEQFQGRVQAVFPELQPKKRWLNAGDDRVRPAHRRANLLAQRPSMDGDFVLTDDDGKTWRAKGPHDARLPASLTVRCRCRSVLDIDSVAPLLEAGT